MPEKPKAILFGAIGTLTETSDMQRRSFNAAFRDAGLEWSWGREAYVEMLRSPGGRDRIADYAESKGEEVDADRIHAAKVAHFRALVEKDGLILREGVKDVIAQAREDGVKLGFVTTTGTDTVDLILNGLSESVSRKDFAFIGDRDMVTEGKPSAEIYRLALNHLGLTAGEAVAIEDTPESATAAVTARIECVGFPGEAARGRIFPDAVTHVVDRLEPVFCGLGRG
ncbi:HAD family hydrolase [Jannaschia sp. CCS1]|uniref:HAD family hydrolase n=1 Tax=Jannaschia sp. (strain CCS1) TaxID=290400 RepID=UPI000053AC25|nr:HAD family hydrolase [Jannaschia sp. CCS1]ABD53981.1 Haloacid dehalogenase-like hydrolase [Jannaschia sp. CCS1]